MISRTRLTTDARSRLPLAAAAPTPARGRSAGTSAARRRAVTAGTSMPRSTAIAAPRRPAPRRALVTAELACKLANPSFIAWREVRRRLVAHDFIRRPRAVEQILQLSECRRAHGATRPTKHREANRAIERRQLLFGHRPRELLRQAQPRDATRCSAHVLDVVVDGNSATADVDGIRQREEGRSHVWSDDGIKVDRELRRPKFVHRSHTPQCALVERRELRHSKARSRGP